MAQPDQEASRDANAARDITLTLLAEPANLSLVRSLAAAVGVTLDFDIDTMADLRMAVDELCATVITRARPGATLTCRFRPEGSQISVTAWAPATSELPIDQGSFGWMVLSTLAESVSARVGTVDGTAGPSARVELTVRRREDTR